MMLGKFKPGDRVTWWDDEINKEVEGEIVRLNADSDFDDHYLVKIGNSTVSVSEDEMEFAYPN